MKKIFSIISAGLLAIMAVSCVQEDLKVFDPSNATAPVLQSYTLDENGISASFTPGSFNMGFNDKVPVNHTLVLLSANGNPVNKTVSATVDGSTITASASTINKMLLNMGYEEGANVSLELLIRAMLQGTVDNGSGNGSLDSQGHITGSFVVTLPKGNPWTEFTETSPWGITGSIASVGFNWDKDIVMYMTPDGNKHVARNVKLAASDQFKFRKDGGWTDNFGAEGDVEPFVLALDTEYPAAGGGKNLAVPADGNYDLLLDTQAGTFTLSEAFQTYPGFDEASTWGVTGSIASFELNWDKDIAMITDGTWHVAEGVVLTPNDQFKFRKDQAWTDNFGAEGDVEPFVCSLDTEYPAAGGGKNLAVAEEGTYDLLVNPDARLFKVVESLGGKSGLVGGGDEPEPEPEPVTGWNIIGLNGDWENDVLATENNGVWMAYITANDATEFKWRKDGGWAENYGGDFVAFGEPFAAVQDGGNIPLAAGFYQAVLDLSDPDNPTITVSEGHVWSLIGVNGDWATDIDMVLTDGKWVSPVTKISGEFKLRENHGWDNNRGGTFVAIGEPFAVENNGANINVEEGNYVVTYDPEAETVVVNETGWGLVGTINGWGSSPDIILKESGLFLVAKNVTLTADDEIKLRYKSDWGVNRGARTAVGQAVKAFQDGPNIKPGVAGNYDVYYRPDSDVIFVLEAGSELTYWGVVGTINGWAAPDRIMYQDESGKYVYDDLETTGAAEIKLRQNEDWAVNRGGDFVDFGEPIAVENNGGNIKLGRDAKFSIVYDSEAETVTLNGEYTGEAPALPETMYIIGDGVGGWDWAADYIVDMTPVNGKPGQFWAIRYIEAGKGFKFCDVKEWKGDFTGLGENTGYTVADGNCFVAENGVYMIYVDVENKKLCVEPAKVFGKGDCFGGWEADPVAFTIEGDKVVGKTTGEGEIRLYADSTIATTDWWTREFVFFDGKIAYRGNGGDQDRVKVEAGKTVTLDFNAGTAVVE
ncbi:MAG: SusF/SusE family outer membrane protein [Bacteroidales bacterium]|nr:SusF/SusE family outer membrane protein [Bacteroidales bacterium]